MWKNFVKKFDSTDSIVSLVLGLAVVLVISMTIVNYVKSRNQPAASITKTAEEKTVVPTPSPTKTYTVVKDDTLWSIAQKQYTSGYNWVDIRDANHLINPNLIEVGQTLIIPNIQAISAASTNGKPKDEKYTVVQGDNLWNIAEYEYSNGYKWADIAQANNLANPDIIHAGNILMMP